MTNNKVALVTGATRGIGRAIALQLAKDGFDIAIVYSGSGNDAAETERLIEEVGGTCRSFKCDVSHFDQSEALVKQVVFQMGPVYALVNNAGITRDKLVLQMKEEDFDSVLDVNLKGTFNLIHHCYAGFVRQRGGRIINISSVVGLMGNAGQASYAASKAGVIGLTKSVAKELAGRGITCNAVAPGMIETDMTKKMPEKARDALLQAIPLKRAGTAEEVAALVSFLASEKAAYITGSVLSIDGGLYM